MSNYTPLGDNNSKHLSELKKQVNALKITKNTSIRSIQLLRDILDKQIRSGAEDANIALTKSKLGKAYSYTNLKDAIKYLKEAYDFYRDNHDHKSMIELSFDIGTACLDTYILHKDKYANNEKKSILQEALAYFTEFDDTELYMHPDDVVFVKQHMASTLYYLGRYNEACIYYDAAIRSHTYYSSDDDKYSLGTTFIDRVKQQCINTLPLLYKPKNNDTSLNKEFYIRALVIKGNHEYFNDKFISAHKSYTTAKSLIEDKNYYNKNMTYITEYFRQGLYDRIIKVNAKITNERQVFNSIKSTNATVLARINNANWPAFTNANNSTYRMGGSRKYTRKHKNRRHGRTQRK